MEIIAYFLLYHDVFDWHMAMGGSELAKCFCVMIVGGSGGGGEA